MDCPKCGRTEVVAHATDTHLCVECVNAENSRVTYLRQHQDDWLTVAKESGLDAWVMQPGETQWEYTVWTKYRDSYPGKKPSYGSVARELETTFNVVSKIAQRWQFPIRMQLWMRNVDEITLAQRREEMLSMNATHISLARKVNEKINAALDAMVPTDMKPSEIASLMKTAAELERKARIDTEAQEELQRDLFVDPNLKNDKKQQKPEDMSEILKILGDAGMLDSLVVKKTTTTTTELKVDNAIDVECEVIEDDES